MASWYPNKKCYSEVFIGPQKIRKPTKIYKTLIREFEFCSKNRIVPIR